MSLFFAVVGYLLLAIVFVLDKLILTKSVPNTAVYTFYSTIFMIAALLCVPFGIVPLQGIDWLLALVSGVSFGLGIWTMFIAIKESEATHMSPFIGAVTTLATFALASVFSGGTFSTKQIIGIVILVVASGILSFEQTKHNSGFHVGYLWAILSGVLFAVSHYLAKHIYGIYPFVSGFVWTRAAIGLVGIFLLFLPSVRASFHHHRHLFHWHKKTSATVLVVINKILAVVSVVAIQYAISLGDVTVINALAGIQYVGMFVIILALTTWKPKIMKEYFTKREIVVEIFALFLAIVGLLFVA